MAALEVRTVESTRDERAFLALPYRLYRSDPRWVPPLRISESQRWDPKRNSSLRRLQVRRFLAYRGRQPVGRIAAIVDESFDRWEEGSAFFGFFECERDPAAARALFEAAEATMRLWGRNVVLGPVNLTTHDEVGLLVEGFASRPTVLTGHNPPFYSEIVEAAGYQGAKDYLAFDWTPDSILSPAIERVGRQIDAGGYYRGIRIRCVDPERFEEEARKLHSLYNTCFADLWGFVDLSWAEFWERTEEFRQFYHPDFVQLAERDGEPVGFALVLPDANEVLANLGGRLLPFGWLKARRGLPRIRTLRFILIGVRPDRTGAGLAAALVHRLREPVRRHGMKKVEVSLVQADNSKMLTLVKAMRCQQTKTYRLFRRDL